MQPRKFRAGQESAGGIVGIGEEHHARGRGHGSQQRIDIGAIILVGRHHRGRAAAPRGNIIDRKAIADIQHLVARPGEGLRRQIEQFVRTGAADNPRRINPMQRAQRLAQGHAIGIGIAIRRIARPASAANARGLVPSGFSLAESLISSAPVRAGSTCPGT